MLRRFLTSALRSLLASLEQKDAAAVGYAKAPVPSAALIDRVQEMTMTGFWRLDCRTGNVFWSPQVFSIHDMPVSDHVDLDLALSYYPAESYEKVTAAVEEASATGKSFDHELDFVSESGTPKRVRAIGQAEWKGGEIVALIGVFQDVSQRYRLEQHLREVATTDELTGLPNRRHLRMYFEDRGLGRGGASAQPFVSVLVDLDHFKQLNDSYGHEAGDHALKVVAERLRHPSLRDSFAVRLGGDEFVLLIENEGLLEDIEATSRNLLALLNQPFRWEGRTCALSATIGIGWFEQRGQELSEVLRCADAALYSAKKKGRGTAVITSPEDLLMDTPNLVA